MLPRSRAALPGTSALFVQAFDPRRALFVLLAHGSDVGVDLLPAARGVAARGLLGADAAENFHHVGRGLGGLDGDPDPPWRQVYAAVEDERAVRPQGALYLHDSDAHFRLLPGKVRLPAIVPFRRPLGRALGPGDNNTPPACTTLTPGASIT